MSDNSETTNSLRLRLSESLALRLRTVYPDLETPLISELAVRFLDAMSVIGPSKQEEAIMHVINVRVGGRGGGRSTKAHNILLDSRKLLASIAKVGLALAAVASKPWIAPLTFLVIWDDLISRAKIDIQEREASVIWTIWMHKDDCKCIAKDGLLSLVNHERQLCGRSPLTTGELEDALRALRKLRCIDEARGDASKWWVREFIRVEYD